MKNQHKNIKIDKRTFIWEFLVSNKFNDTRISHIITQKIKLKF